MTLFLTTCFHGNLGYSSISESRFSEVIKTCYWPILTMAEELDIPIGIEFPAHTLEYIQERDDGFIHKLKWLWKKRQIEIIGSGYVQSIFPLIPWEVNAKNLEMGNEIYAKILGALPKIGFVNEQCFSAGLVSLYRSAGYKGIILDWINASKCNDFSKECFQNNCNLEGGGDEIPVIWNDSIAFQKLQRYVYGDLDRIDYIEDLFSNFKSGEDRTYMIYGNDMEVFNFRARDPNTLHSGDVAVDEIGKIRNLFQTLNSDKRAEFILPGDTLTRRLKKNLRIQTAEYPILTKKQDKYNVCRWAVCGNNNWKSNSLCYRAYHLLKKLDQFRAGNSNRMWWEKLVALWASDFRTHTEKEKYAKFSMGLSLLVKDLETEMSLQDVNVSPKSFSPQSDKSLIRIDPDAHLMETDEVFLCLSPKKGGTIAELRFKFESKEPFIKLLRHGYYNDISYGVDFFSGHTIIFNHQQKITDLSNTKIKYRRTDTGSAAVVSGKIGQNEFTKIYKIKSGRARLDIDIVFDFKEEIHPSVFRTFILTLNPDCFDRNGLYYKTVNGGKSPEFFPIKNEISQNEPVDFHVTSRHCLGSTDEWMAVGDGRKELVITTNKAQTYSVPMIEFKTVKESYLFRIYNSVSETDETSHGTLFRGKRRFSYSLMPGRVHRLS